MPEYIIRKLSRIKPHSGWVFLGGLAVVVFALCLIARAADLDDDGMDDAYESFFGLNVSSNDASFDYDNDNLSNIEESSLWTDPYADDTDRDGFNDGEDNVPDSRIFVEWGEPRFTSSNTYSYPGPDWWLEAWKNGGQWDTNTPAWHVSPDNTNVAEVYIDLLRCCLTNDVAMKLNLYDHTNASIYVDLVDTNYVTVATNLFGNVMSGSDQAITFTTNVPMSTYTNASTIVLWRGSGEIDLYTTSIYIDQDGDGLDADQEEQLGTSDLDADTDGDGLDDYSEVFTHNTDPNNCDSDDDGLSDGYEVANALDPDDPDTDNDGIDDGDEVYYGKNPAISNNYSALPFVELFETNTVTIGALHGQNNWEAPLTNSVLVQTGTVYAGQQALEMDRKDSQTTPKAAHLFKHPVSDMVWLDTYVQPMATEAPTGTVDFASATFFKSDGYLVVYDGLSASTNKWTILTNMSPVNLESSEWVRLTIGHDFSNQQWLVCLNGVLVSDGLGFGAERKKFSSIEIEGNRALCDNLNLSETKPSGLSLDGDSLPDEWEIEHFSNLDQGDEDDPDGDGFDNLTEYVNGTDPTSADTDNDGMPDAWETGYGLDPNDSSDASEDPDSDGLTNLEEYQHNTDPGNSDTDGDGLSDGYEVNTAGTDPLDTDSDNDGYIDSAEVNAGLDPLDASSCLYSNFTHRMKLSFKTTDASLTDMPVLVVLNTDRIDYSQFKTGGADIRFCNPSGEELDYEISEWNTSAVSRIWVRIPLISSSMFDNHFWMHWGNASAGAGENKAGVWTNAYAGVWHLDEESPSMSDSSPEGNPALNNGSVPVDGHLGRARDFQGENSIIMPPEAFDKINTQASISFWQNVPLSRDPGFEFLFQGSNPFDYEFTIGVPYGHSFYGDLIYWVAMGQGDYIATYTDESEYQNKWSYWTFTKDSSSGIMRIYRNGELYKSASGKTDTYSPVTSVRLGSAEDGSWNYSGMIDEFFVSEKVRSPEWIKAQYQSMNDDYLVYHSETVAIAAIQDGTENGANGQFTLTRSGTATNLPLTVNYEVSGSATAGLDYTNNLTGSVVLPAGQTQSVVTVYVINDTLLEGTETVNVALSEGNYLIDAANSNAVVSILDSDVDTDSDSMSDAWETANFGDLSHDGTADSDSDGLTDLEEHNNNTDPNNSDTDGDGLSDGNEVNNLSTDPTSADTDNDGMPDGWEVNNSLDPNDPSDTSADPDGDGVLNLDEYTYGLDPNSALTDSDGDTLSDADELYIYGTNPLLADSDTNGVDDASTVLQWSGTNTSYRHGGWTNIGSVLHATTNHLARLEYSGAVPTGGMYRIGLEITNCYSVSGSKTFKVQALVDGIPAGWFSIPVSTGQTATGYVTTPWLPATNHTFRLAWLDDYSSDKELGVVSVIVQAIDAPDSNSNGRQDWVEDILSLELDSDRDGLSDLYELDTSLTDPLKWDTDGDHLGDGEEINVFGFDPLDADSNSNGINDSYMVVHKDGVDTSKREVWHNFNVFHEDGATLYYNGEFTANRALYEVTVSNAGMYRVALQMRNYEQDLPDDFRFEITLAVNEQHVGTYDMLVDVDRSGRGYITLPWLTPGTYTLALQKFANGYYGGGRNLYPAYEAVEVFAIDGGEDANTNGIPDWAEEFARQHHDMDQDGLSDYDELVSHGTSAMAADSDGDGLSDGEELILGTDSLDPDSDDDGVSDWDEAREALTDPLNAEFDGTVTDMATVTGSQTNEAAGDWVVEGTEIRADRRRGYVEYTLNCSTGDMYRLKVEATHKWLHSTCSPAVPVDTSDLMIYVDGQYLGKKTLVAPDGIYSAVRAFTPWLDPGSHTVRIFWENVHTRTSLKIKEIKLQQLGGPDTDSDGVKDWVQVSIGNITGLDSIPATSVVSPVCLEGNARYTDMISCTSGATNVAVLRGAGDRWYADVDLADDTSTPVTVSFQNNAVSITTNLTWTPLNLLTGSDQLIREADSVMFTAQPGGATNGTVTVQVASGTNTLTNVLAAIDQHVIFEFASAGEYTVTGTYSNQAGTSDGSVNVTVVGGSFPKAMPVTYSTNVIEASDASILMDDSLSLSAKPDGATNGTMTIEILEGTNVLTNVVTTVGSPYDHTFAAEGLYTVTGSFSNQTTTTNSSMQVTVNDGPYPGYRPACMLGSPRTWSCPDLPLENVSLHTDSTVALSGDNQSIKINASKVNKPHCIVARLGEDGPVLDSARLAPFWIQAAVDGYMWVVERYDDSALWENRMITKNVPDDVDIKLQIVTSGVTFDDLTLTRWLTSEDIDDIGEHYFRMIRPNSVGSTCHTIKSYQDGVYLGQAYYSGVLMPDE